MKRGFLPDAGSGREARLERIFLAAVVQTVISGPVGGTPMPEIIMSAVRELRVRDFLQSEALRTSPWEMVRWASRADGGTWCSKRRAVSLDGLRTTERGVVSDGLVGEDVGYARAVQS